MNLSARFYTSVMRYGAYSSIELQPVVRGEHNKPWSSATPSGKVSLMSLSDEERDWFARELLARRTNGGGAEFDATITDERTDHPVCRPIRITGIHTLDLGASGRVIFTPGSTGGPYVEMDLTITNPSAFTQCWDAFVAHTSDCWLSLS